MTQVRDAGSIVLACGLSVLAGAQDAARPTEYPSLAAASKSMLLYKFAPESFSEEEILKRAASQIQQDQWYHQAPHERHSPLFAREAVEGRNPQFAARELLDEYRSKLAQLAEKLPRRYSVAIAVRVPQEARFDPTRGVLHTTRESDFLVRLPARGELGYGEAVPVEDREVYDIRAVNNRGGALGMKLQDRLGYHVTEDEALAAMPVSMAVNVPVPRHGRLGGELLLALDRLPNVPAFAIAGSDAERMLTPPERPRLSLARDADGRSPMDRYTEEFRQYLEAFVFFVDFEIQDIVPRENSYLVLANVLGGRLLGTRGELLKDFAASEFSLVARVREREAGAQREADARAQAERQAEDAAALASLAHLDILGVRLGMSLDDAESTLRREQQIETAYRFSGGAPQTWPRKYNPYTDGRLFVANHGQDTIVLYHDDKRKVIGVTRNMRSQGLTKEALVAGLIEKCGEPTSSTTTAWNWTHPHADMVKCRGTGNLNPHCEIELIEGDAVKNVTYGAVGIGLPDYASAESLADCHATLQVTADFRGKQNPAVQFRLFDHSGVAEALKQSQQGTPPRALNL